jgi:hypothetical protein
VLSVLPQVDLGDPFVEKERWRSQGTEWTMALAERKNGDSDDVVMGHPVCEILYLVCVAVINYVIPEANGVGIT